MAASTLASLFTNFGLSPLIGKPVALISDGRLSTKADSKIVVERLLSVSGEDSLTIDRKYRDPYTGRLPTRFVIMSNELPRLADASGALASRFVLLVLSRSFYGTEKPGLTNELLAEAPAIFNWSPEGLDRLNHRGYFVNPESGADAIREMEDLSSPVGAFIRDRCVVGVHQRVDVDRMWDAWKTWCESQSHHHRTKAIFGRDLKAAVPMMKPERPRGGGRRTHVSVGIGLVEDTLPNSPDRRDRPDQETLSDHQPGHSGLGAHSDSALYSRQKIAMTSGPRQTPPLRLGGNHEPPHG